MGGLCYFNDVRKQEEHAGLQAAAQADGGEHAQPHPPHHVLHGELDAVDDRGVRAGDILQDDPATTYNRGAEGGREG